MRKERWLYTAAFLMDCSLAGMFLCAPLLAVSFGATYDDLGMIGALGFLAYTLSCLVSGAFSERVGYQRSLALSALAVCVSIGLMGRARGLSHVYILSGTTWFVLSGFWPALQAWLGQGKTPTQLLSSLGRFNVSWSTGALVGPIVWGAVFARNTSLTFYLCAGLVGVIAVAFSLARFHDTAPPKTAAPITPHPLSSRFLTIARVSNFATVFGVGTVLSLLPKLALDLGVAPATVGRMMAVLGLCELTSFYIVARLAYWQYRLWPIIAAQALGIAGMLALAVGHSAFSLAIGLVGPGLLLGLTFTSSIYYGLASGGAGGRRAGVHEAIAGAGLLFGPLMGGFAGEHVGPRAPYLLAACVLLCAVVCEVLVLTRKPDVRPS